MSNLENEAFVINPGVNHLPRGGYVVPSSSGLIQFGAPPETIKDTMILPEKVPRIFVLPDQMFSIEKGIAVAELEFPIYYNHFLCQKKTYILGTKEQQEQLTVVLKESVFGPEKVDLSSEYPEGEKSEGYPNIKAEMDFFRGNRTLDDLIHFAVFKKNRIQINNVIIDRDEKKGFLVYDEGKLIAEVPLTIEYRIKHDVGARLPEPYEAPEFGITCLGPSHGFDPSDNTSGFIIWVNGRGIMIDPPVNSTEWLRSSNVNPKLIDHIILTHTHADHDAGTFQKILEEFPVTIHTTETIMDSFIRKYTALTKMTKKQLYNLFNFQPVILNTPLYIEGAKFIYHYSLHSIPTIGFRMHYQNQSFVYTSDHLNDPATIDKLNELGVFPKNRHEFLKAFPWHYNIIYHEGGIPPLHTPVSYLASLPEEIQKKITVYHIARKDFPEKSHLNMAKFGIQNTLYPEIISAKYSSAIKILDVLNHVDLFRDFSITKAREILMVINEVQYKRGDLIIHKDTAGDKFYVIISGNVSVSGIDSDVKKTYGKYEYFGEASIITGENRSADIIAETDVYALTIERSAFLNLIAGTQLETELRKLIDARKSNSWDVLSKSKIFGSMTSHQKTQIESLMKLTNVKGGSNLIEYNKTAEMGYILIKGTVNLIKNNKVKHEFLPGDFIGDIFGLLKNIKSTFTARAVSDVEIYCIDHQDMSAFIQKNPGIYMRLVRFHEEIIGD
ncbi:MAG: cAMP/cGMP-dependent 3',5'-cyclic-AMP/GMP phosphodiesterase [Spirochaetia bacterium]|nr:cAMP/cGMP-dependent 3',5'-cyclic-AMP/GMP phosphodiesterase [Spirochaetia bacterium]